MSTTAELPTPPPGFEAVSEQLTDLPKVMLKAWQSMAPRTGKALNILEGNIPDSIPCNKCDEPREFLQDRSLAVTARRCERPELRYEPCKKCFPWAWYTSRAENMGVPPTQPVCVVQREQTGEVISRKLAPPSFLTRSDHLYITGDKRKAIHGLVMSSANGWLLEQSTLEACVDMGAQELLSHALSHVYAVAIVVSPQDRGEFLQRISARRMRTWIIDPEECAGALIPENFYRVTA